MAVLTSMDLEDSEGTHQSRMKLIRELLLYVPIIYRDIPPNFKGLILKLDSWRPYIDEDVCGL